MKLICVCRKASRNAKASPTRKDSPGRGRWHASAERGQWHRAKRRCRRGCTEQHLRSPLNLKASFVQPLSLASARQLSWQESPWQRGFVFDETDLCLLENVTECQSLSLWERCLRSRRRGQGCCQRARHTAIRTLLVRAIVSQRRWSNFTGLALSGADAPAPPKWEPLAKRCRFR